MITEAIGSAPVVRRQLANVLGAARQSGHKVPEWYEIRNATAKEAEVWIYSEISPFFGVDAETFVRDLAKITASTINLRINSPGGSVFAGLSIYNALRRHPATVITHVDGLAASIASVVALAGEEVRVAENAFMMIHNAHGVTIGNAADMREMADLLDKVSGAILNTYASRTGKDADELKSMMDAETWFTAQEAVEAGFADSVVDAKDAAASFDLTGFEHVPADLAASAVAPDGWAETERALWAERSRLAALAASVVR